MTPGMMPDTPGIIPGQHRLVMPISRARARRPGPAHRRPDFGPAPFCRQARPNAPTALGWGYNSPQPVSRRGISESGATCQALPLTGATLIIEPEMAQLQLDETAAAPATAGPDAAYPGVIPKPGTDDDTPTPTPQPAPQPRRPRRVTARKTVQSDVALYDFNRLRDEIIRNLRNDGGSVTVEVIISGEKADGFSASITRAIRENSLQLELEFTASDYAGAP